MRVTLIHNSGAGDGVSDPHELIDLLRERGHSVHYRSSKDPALAQALTWPADLIVTAGGDGTVSKVLKQLSADAPPVGILPLGTANNIAVSLGICGAHDALIEGWENAKVGHIDIGTVDSADGIRSVVEGIGIGAFAAAMRKLDDITGPPEEQIARARTAIVRAMETKKPRTVELDVDGRRAALDVIFAEITNISRIGPKINLAPWAEPNDGKAEVVYATEEKREALVNWLKEGDWGVRPPVECLSGREITVLTAHKRLRVDDDLDVPIAALPLTLDMSGRRATILLPRGPNEG